MIIPTELRLRARNAMKAYLPFALLVTLLASLPSLIAQMAFSFSATNIVNAILQYQYAEPSLSVVRRVISAAFQSMTPQVRVLWYALPFLYLSLPFLNIGRMYFTLRMLRGADAGVGDLLARAGCFFKAIALEILILVKMLLWSLPGFAVAMLGVLFLIWGAGTGVFTFMYTAGMVVMVVLMIRASLHYTFAAILMADIPEKGPVTCLKESIALMKNHVAQLFSVIVTFVLYMLLSELIVNLVNSISYPIALIVNLLLNLLIACYMTTTVCAYYEERMKENRKEEPASELDGEQDTEI